MTKGVDDDDDDDDDDDNEDDDSDAVSQRDICRVVVNLRQVHQASLFCPDSTPPCLDFTMQVHHLLHRHHRHQYHHQDHHHYHPGFNSAMF